MGGTLRREKPTFSSTEGYKDSGNSAYLGTTDWYTVAGAASRGEYICTPVSGNTTYRRYELTSDWEYTTDKSKLYYFRIWKYTCNCDVTYYKGTEKQRVVTSYDKSSYPSDGTQNGYWYIMITE